MAAVLPRLIECAITERAKMNLPPSAAQETPADRHDAAMAGLALAEKAGVGNYIVFPDKDRPPGFQGAPAVWGHVGVPGPGGQLPRTPAESEERVRARLAVEPAEFGRAIDQNRV